MAPTKPTFCCPHLSAAYSDADTTKELICCWEWTSPSAAPLTSAWSETTASDLEHMWGSSVFQPDQQLNEETEPSFYTNVMIVYIDHLKNL